MLTVPPRTHRVEFHFTGLSLVAPERVRFRYRLDPFDSDWTEAGTRRVAYYTGIPPGNYQFRVTACNNDAVWNREGVGLGLVVLPSWWMTWWFRALMVLGVAGLVLGWYEQRLRRLRHEHLAQESFSRRLIASQENERRRIAGELHDGLGQDLLVISSQAQLGLGQQENPPATTARLKDIAETAKQALQQARRMAHNLRPGLLDELGFTKAVRASADKAAQASGISMTIHLADVDGLLPPEFEVNLFRITQETLNNVLKHAHASAAKITLTKESSVLRLVVEDNGRGFELSRQESAPPDQRGFGLRQIAERARMMGGRVDIQSQPGHGTRLTVEVPLVRVQKAE
jgi:signal transduction histidine kinase